MQHFSMAIFFRLRHTSDSLATQLFAESFSSPGGIYDVTRREIADGKTIISCSACTLSSEEHEVKLSSLTLIIALFAEMPDRIQPSTAART